MERGTKAFAAAAQSGNRVQIDGQAKVGGEPVGAGA